MKKKTKLYLRLNLISLFFVVVSFISLTLAWFVYSGLSTVQTEVDVKAWYITLEKDGEEVSNTVTISLDDIYPGMEPIQEEIKIKNLGDSNAQVKYSIVNARILGEEKDNYNVETENLDSEYVEDRLAHHYPFHINIDLSKKFVTAKTDETVFRVSISWPLNSGNDELDSIWGTNAYNYKKEEQNKKNADPSYQIKAAIKLELQLIAEQYIETEEASDIKYRIGNEILYDVSLNKRCFEEGGSCIRTNVIGNEILYDETNKERCYEESETCVKTNLIDVNNTLADTKVTLLPKITNETAMSSFYDLSSIFKSRIRGWNVESRLLTAEDILMISSKDILESVLVRENFSDLIIGNLKYENRVDNIIEMAKNDSGYFSFLNKFLYFNSDVCYWVNNEYNSENGTAFAVQTNNDLQITKLYEESKSTECKVIPVIIAEKVNLN